MGVKSRFSVSLPSLLGRDRGIANTGESGADGHIMAGNGQNSADTGNKFSTNPCPSGELDAVQCGMEHVMSVGNAMRHCMATSCRGAKFFTSASLSYSCQVLSVVRCPALRALAGLAAPGTRMTVWHNRELGDHVYPLDCAEKLFSQSWGLYIMMECTASLDPVFHSMPFCRPRTTPSPHHSPYPST